MIFRADYPELNHICWHMGGATHVDRAQAFALYERNWAYVDVNAMTDKEIALLTELAKTEGGGVFAPHGGQPIKLEGVVCA